MIMSRILKLVATLLMVVGSFEGALAETVGGVAAVPSEVPVTIRSSTNSAGVVNWSTLVTLRFPYAATLTTWGAPVRQGTAINLDFTAVKSTAANALPSTLNREASFGALPPGNYTFTVTTRGLTVATKTFTVPNPPPVVQKTTIAVDQSNPAAVRATVHVDFGGYYALKNQLPVTRDANGRYVLEANVERVAVAQVVPFPKIDLAFALGAVSPGTYGVVFRMNGKAFQDGNFTVKEAPPPPIAVRVSATFGTTSTGTTAKVKCIFPDALVEVQDDGPPVLQGQTVTVSLKATVLPTRVPVTEPTVFEKAYAGKLAFGNYRLVVKINGLVRAEIPFVVPVVEPPPPPPVGGVAAVPSETPVTIRSTTNSAGVVNWSTVVTMRFPYAATLTTWGAPVRQGTAIKLDFTAVKSTVADALPSTLTRDAGFGALPPGNYTFTVTTRGLTVATKTFTVPNPPPVVQQTTITVDPSNPANVLATVHVDFGGYYALKSQSPLSRDANGRYVLEANVESVAVAQAEPKPPFTKLDLVYPLGAVSPGTYGVVFRMNGKAFQDGGFTVPLSLSPFLLPLPLAPPQW